MRIVRSFIIAAAALVAAVPPAQSRQIEGIRFAPSVTLRETELALNGVGLMRWRSLIKVYAAAFYLPPGASPARALDDVPKRLEIEYLLGFDASDFVRATNESLPKNATAATIAAAQSRIDRLNALYRDVEPGDRYALTYLPGVGTELSLNGKPLGNVPGADLARLVFAIWLGPEPLDASLKTQLLGPL